MWETDGQWEESENSNHVKFMKPLEAKPSEAVVKIAVRATVQYSTIPLPAWIQSFVQP